MEKYAWCTDPHIDHLHDDDNRIIAFGQKLIADNPTGIIISGDISTARKVTYHLSALERVVQRPIYFVLGNHDYYHGSIDAVRKEMSELGKLSSYLRYLPTSPYFNLTPKTAIIGHDCWYDAQYGNWQNSRFMMSDWMLIHDFLPHSGGPYFMRNGNVANKGAIVGLAQKLAREGVTHLMNGIKAATRYATNIIIVTHFPPFDKAHIHQGQIGDDYAQPWFTNKMCGEMLMDAARAYPNVDFRVFAGHTHGQFYGRFAKNLEVSVGAADYGNPEVAGLIEVI